MHSGIAKRMAAAVLIGLLAIAGPMASVAVAETSEEIQARLDDAKAELAGLYDQAEAAAEELNHTRVLLEETATQIEDTQTDIKATQDDIAVKQAELSEAKDVLTERISSNYKAGNVSILSIVLHSSSFSELVSNMYYAGKIARSDADAIEAVKLLKAELQQKESELQAKEAELEAKKAEQEQLAAQQEAQKAELDAKAAEAEEYVSKLDQELQDKLEEERIAAEEAARKAAEEEAARQAAAAAAAAQAAQEAGGQAPAQPQDNPAPSGDVSGDWRSIVVNSAYSRVGGPYVFGAGGPTAFDCSGLTSWCYAQAGIYINHSSYSQSSFCTKPASQAQYGDVVWRPGHVGICIGNGQTIEAFSPRQGIGFGSIYDFQTAGSPVG